MPLDPDRTVAALIVDQPALVDALVALGFAPLANPAVRAVMAPRTTLREACERHGRPLAGVLTALDARLAGGVWP
ncbi:MAG: DUF1858 domain-containing protein [Planctomycetes bacterium]|nr:DUF1858 domain-containing protein [Planctomycetota bacterium]